MQFTKIKRQDFFDKVPGYHNQIYHIWDNNESAPFGDKLYEALEMSFRYTIATYLDYVLGPDGVPYFFEAFGSEDDALDYVAHQTESHISNINLEALYDAIGEIRAIAVLSKFKKMKVQKV